MSAYLLGNLMFIVVWVVLFLKFPKTKKLQLFGSVLLLPFAVLDFWFRPNYWHPPLLIHQIEPLSLETAVYCFVAGGIVIVVGSWISKTKDQFKINWKNLIYFLVISFGFYAIFQSFLVSNAMNNLNFSFLTIWLVLLLTNPKENIKSLIPAAIFAIFTIVAINFALIFYPNFVVQYWNLPKLWRTFLWTPTEEIFFAGILAALWSVLPKYLTHEKA
ncbi:MAG: hypothetical protein NTY30_01725 [Candidatus Berkelbacteria bacterium]|nr:hypothetical protein [Candidatus Berkelbacteria bacterium]